MSENVKRLGQEVEEVMMMTMKEFQQQGFLVKKVRMNSDTLARLRVLDTPNLTRADEGAAWKFCGRPVEPMPDEKNNPEWSFIVAPAPLVAANLDIPIGRAK